jgi:thioredoxin 1
MAGDKIINLTKANFEQEIADSDKPILVDFWASWCGPCRAVAPVMEELSKEYDGKARIAKVNVDEEGELAAKFRVMSIPTVILFKDGQQVEKIIGARSKEEFTRMLDKNI